MKRIHVSILDFKLFDDEEYYSRFHIWEDHRRLQYSDKFEIHVLDVYKRQAVYDVSKTHVSELIAEIFRASHIVIACATYNGGIYPPMENLLNDMKALSVQKRTVALMDNGTCLLYTSRCV